MAARLLEAFGEDSGVALAVAGVCALCGVVWVGFAGEVWEVSVVQEEIVVYVLV